MAPEIILSQGHDYAVDYWSLGTIIYEMVSGHTPFYHKDRQQMFKNILEKPVPMRPEFSSSLIDLLNSLLVVNVIYLLYIIYIIYIFILISIFIYLYIYIN